MVIVCDYPNALVRQISPTIADIQKWSRLPLLLMTGMCGMTAGLGMCMSKVALEVLKQDGWNYTVVITGTVAWMSATVQMIYFNMSMNFYKQIEITPIFQSFYCVTNIVFGMLVLNEAKQYVWSEFIGICLTSCAGFIGVYIIYIKQKSMH